LTTLFFVSCVFICVTDGTYAIEKDKNDTSVHFFVQN